MTQTKEALLKLIYIEKRNMTKQKSVKENGNNRQPIPIYSQKCSARIVTSKYSFAKSGQSDFSVNDQHPKLFKDFPTDKLYMKQNMEYVLTRSTELPSNFLINTP